MLKKYNLIYQCLKKHAPKDAEHLFDKYINEIIKYYETNKTLAVVEIMDIMYDHKQDADFKTCLADIYDQYNASNFAVAKLASFEQQHIVSRYIDELRKYGKERRYAI